MSQQLAIDFNTPRAIGAEMAERCTTEAEERNPGFTLRARDFVIRYLSEHGNSPGEEIVEAASAGGIFCEDRRAWGSVFARMSGKQIRCLRSDLPRRAGHGTGGGRLWSLIK